MQTVQLDNRPVMLNDKEHGHWIDTGEFKRIPDGDEEDTAYCKMRDRMIDDGNEKLYEAITPPASSVPPLLFWQAKIAEMSAKK